ncbi:MAG: hypothetical protein QMB63_07660 [Clostridiaceae bacterium]
MEKVLKKLGYKGEVPVLILNAPESFKSEAFSLFGEAPKEDFDDKKDKNKFKFVMVFLYNLTDVEKYKKIALDALHEEGRVYLTYPKKSSKKYKSDISRDILWPMLGEFGYEPVSLFSVDDDWSAMRFKKAEDIKSMIRTVASTEVAQKRIDEMNKKKSPEELERDQAKKSGIYGKLKKEKR